MPIVNGILAFSVFPLRESWGWYEALIVEAPLWVAAYIALAYLAYRLSGRYGFQTTVLAGVMLMVARIAWNRPSYDETQSLMELIEIVAVVHFCSFLALPCFLSIAWWMGRSPNYALERPNED